MSDDAKCVCGEPDLVGVVHRADGPCYRLSPETVYERARKALTDLQNESILVGHTSPETLSAALSLSVRAIKSGEAAEKRAEELQEELRITRVTDIGYRERAEAAERERDSWRRVAERLENEKTLMERERDALQARVAELESPK